QKVAAVWEAQRRPDGLLFAGTDFDEARRWAEANGPFVTDSELSFLEKSREKQRAIERELAAEQEKAGAQPRYARLMLRAALFSIALAVADSVLAVVAVVSKNEAQHQKNEAQKAETRTLAALAREKGAVGDFGTALVLAIEALPDPTAVPVRPYV